ncbi:pheromone receptor [Purpureocillium lavendulum]|uniref:Pheromone receptor n=1 Tax=Purpureocillium lavendulum TaxID=1247861 RepID=A0AB34FVS8_9HYPO|nr:pheromone receptor [Purpureocillium lavendulum]
MSGAAPPGFDPYTQNVTFLAADGVTPIQVPIPDIDAFNDETVSVTINYSIQIGCCIIALVVLLTMTRPLAKLRRVSSVLYALGLATCIVRNALLVAFFLSPLNHFYQFYGGDYSGVPARFTANSVAANVMACLLVLIVEAALVNQAWTTVRLWAEPLRMLLVVASGLVALIAVAFRIGFLVITSRANVELVPPGPGDDWAVEGSVITLAISVFWFCALFNLKLVSHLVTNWRVLPSMRALTSMEVLIMTNGILMIIPGMLSVAECIVRMLTRAAIFAGLEWGSFQNFESQSLIAASVIILLPIGTLIAQQISSRSLAAGGSACSRSDCPCGCHRSTGGSGSGTKTRVQRSDRGSRDGDGARDRTRDEKASIFSALRLYSFSSRPSPTSTTASAARHDGGTASLLSKAERGGVDPAPNHVPDHFDVELRHIDSAGNTAGSPSPLRRDSGYPGGDGRDAADKAV